MNSGLSNAWDEEKAREADEEERGFGEGRMECRVFTCAKFAGRRSVGNTAVVFAVDVAEAAGILNDYLALYGLPADARVWDIKPMEEEEGVRTLSGREMRE